MSKSVSEVVGEYIAMVFGWAYCLGYLVGAYALGGWVATQLSVRGGDREMVGLLSALALIWIYEHFNLENKYNRLRELLDSRG